MIITKYKNGNSEVTLHCDGTREISFPDSGMVLDFPLNVDVRVSTECSFGKSEKTGLAICSFCHESAVQNGLDGDFNKLKTVCSQLLVGTEIAIGCNNLNLKMMDFLKWAKSKGFICNLTVNQGHIKRDLLNLRECISDKLIRGLGVSYRPDFSFNLPKEIIEYENTVFHVIAGIDSVDDVELLGSNGVKKILILGEKDFGFNFGMVCTDSKSHINWRQRLRGLIDFFDVVSFDNLALEQLMVSRFLSNHQWSKFYQGEHSFYIDLPSELFKRSSRCLDGVSMSDFIISDYYKKFVVGNNA